MPDLLAGSIIRALDFTPTVADTQDGTFTFDSTTFGVDFDGGSYDDCGVVFVACTTGRALIHYEGDMDNSSGAASTNIAPAVRTGAVIGSGSDIVAPVLADAVRNTGDLDERKAAFRLVEGLTPGASYNVRLEHRVSGGTGTIEFRHVVVTPAT